MGLLIKGQWHSDWYNTKDSDGEFIREDAQFRDIISSDPNNPFQPESGRYHLYVSLACPWAHRTLIFRELKQLTDHISVSIVSPDMMDNGWTYHDDYPGVVGDNINNVEFHWQLYTLTQSDYSGRVTVPVLWDKKLAKIVNNESSEIIRMLNSAFNALTGNHDDYYPQALRTEIDEINDRIYHTVNNGVYKSGFATSQTVYQKHVKTLFESLDWIEEILSKRRYLLGDQITEADWRLFTTLIRFDAVYVGHFKCNIRTIEQYPNISGYVRDLYQQPGIAATVNMDHIKRHYYYSHTMINPTQVVPEGPYIDYMTSHNRG
ncbi:MAG: glutathione S-transferase family protein [Kangiellaceae bacterium]|jgi:putative glutathione S-transferase|nr:glutathione S-transferase family protein [Kangiellaceae bacterium]